MFRGKLLSVLKAGLFGLWLGLVFSSCAGAPETVAMAPRPEWVSLGPHERYGSQAYLTAVGRGNSRNAAEMAALGQLVSIFGQRIEVDQRVTESYREAMRSGATATWTHYTAVDTDIVIVAGMDTLIGAEIGDFWADGRGNNYALAVMNRDRATQIYSEMIRANQEIIHNLTNMSLAERNTFDGFSRYQLAAVIADMSISYGEVLSVIGAPQYARGLRRGDDFRRGAQEIAREIPISIYVNNDRAGRLHSAFAGAFSDMGFRTGGSNSRYVLDVNVVVQPTDHPGAQVVFSRMELSANLIDVSTGSVLLPFSFQLREGHVTQSEAENRVFIVAERRIDAEYRDLLSDYLSQLIPRR